MGPTPEIWGFSVQLEVPGSLLGVRLPLTPFLRLIRVLCSPLHLFADGHLLCDPDPKGTWGNCFGCKYGHCPSSPPTSPSPTAAAASTRHQAALPHTLSAEPSRNGHGNDTLGQDEALLPGTGQSLEQIFTISHSRF